MTTAKRQTIADFEYYSHLPGAEGDRADRLLAAAGQPGRGRLRAGRQAADGGPRRRPGQPEHQHLRQPDLRRGQSEHELPGPDRSHAAGLRPLGRRSVCGGRDPQRDRRDSELFGLVPWHRLHTPAAGAGTTSGTTAVSGTRRGPRQQLRPPQPRPPQLRRPRHDIAASSQSNRPAGGAHRFGLVAALGLDPGGAPGRSGPAGRSDRCRSPSHSGDRGAPGKRREPRETSFPARPRHRRVDGCRPSGRPRDRADRAGVHGLGHRPGDRHVDGDAPRSPERGRQGRRHADDHPHRRPDDQPARATGDQGELVGGPSDRSHRRQPEFG